jgi:DNA-binding NarL/FixJ family response regulator
MRLGNIYYKILTMMRVFIANTKTEERSALRFMMSSLKLEVVGDAADWQTTLAQAPATNFNLLLVDWDLLPANAAAGIPALRQACSNAISVVLTSYLDAHQQAAKSAGADAFVSKGEIPYRLADHLLAISRNLNSNEITDSDSENESRRYPRSNS